MKAYEILPDDAWPYAYRINASHKWGLPGVKCSQCGFVGGGCGSQYPALTLPEGIEAAPYLEGWPVTPERQIELQAALLRSWKQDIRLGPGTDFGPLVGKAHGKCGDVGWVRLGTMLLADQAVKRICDAGVSPLTLVPTEIKWRSKKAPEYFELQILPGLRLAASYIHALGASRCIKCGILGYKKELENRAARLADAELKYYPVLDATSLPLQWDLLRVDAWEATIVASERFKNAVIQVGLTNLTFREIKVL